MIIKESHHLTLGVPDSDMEATCPYHQQLCQSIHTGELPHADIFFAYPSQPDARVETIQGAIDRFRESNGVDSAIDWSELAIEGVSYSARFARRLEIPPVSSLISAA